MATPKSRLGTLDEVHAPELALVAPVGQVVLAAAVSLELAGVGQQRAGLAELVEADVGERDVLLELRRAADPPAQSLGGDEGVVGEAEDVVHVSVHYRCSTPSGTS